MDKLGSKTIIGAGASFNGKIINARVIEINGKMNADLTADKVTIGEVGHFDGAIRADLVVVSGHYEGNMQAGSVWATATASISGKLHYETLQMDRGAALNCHVVHNWTAKNTAAVPSENDDADLLISATLDKAKNVAVPTSSEEGA
jgi:cytoskeletal protein CcmA (bactofilin family)